MIKLCLRGFSCLMKEGFCQCRRLQNASSGQSRRVWSAVPRFKSHHQMPARPTVKEEEIEEVFIKGGGKGGQKINKTNSKVQLKHVPSGLVVSCQATRSREQNRKIARSRMAEQLEYKETPSDSRLGKLAERRIKRAKNQRKKAMRRKRERQSLKEVC
ncbi:RF-1 domain-containing protein [Lipomyces oligophaga]|uniref:RF-1 domain-containing protein n=1 Tax=Lipomyces oligophaga TaxID=45792 RepID=UPI0034CD133E